MPGSSISVTVFIAVGVVDVVCAYCWCFFLFVFWLVVWLLGELDVWLVIVWWVLVGCWLRVAGVVVLHIKSY